MLKDHNWKNEIRKWKSQEAKYCIFPCTDVNLPDVVNDIVTKIFW